MESSHKTQRQAAQAHPLGFKVFRVKATGSCFLMHLLVCCPSWIRFLASAGGVCFLRVLYSQKVMAAAAAGPAGVHMELGGKSAMIVFDDIEDIDATVDW